jgi:hypothetical protein
MYWSRKTRRAIEYVVAIGLVWLCGYLIVGMPW